MMFPRITKISKVEHFKVTCLWNNGDIRLNDFTKRIENFNQIDHLKLLLDFDELLQISINQGNTLSWMNISRVNIRNTSLPFIPLAFESDRLFVESVIVSSH
jgi:hypothetical protein